MSLQLDEPRRAHKDFYGKNIEQMPVLLSEGYVPMGVAGIMQRRVEVMTASPKVKEDWWGNYWDSGDAPVRHPDGRLKIVLDAQELRQIGPKTKLVAGGLQLTQEAYDALEGQEFSKADVAKYTGDWAKEKQVLDNPIWLALARGDKALLKEYTTAVFTQAKEKWGRDKNMGIYVADSRDEPNMRLWCVRRLGDISNGGVNGFNLLVNSNGRLAGVAPEAQAAEKIDPKTVLEARIAQAIAEPRAFTRGDGLVFVPAYGVKLDK